MGTTFSVTDKICIHTKAWGAWPCHFIRIMQSEEVFYCWTKLLYLFPVKILVTVIILEHVIVQAFPVWHGQIHVARPSECSLNSNAMRLVAPSAVVLIPINSSCRRFVLFS